MPCFSTVTETKFENHERLAEALSKLGYQIRRKSELSVIAADKTGQTIEFSRYRAGLPFTTTSTDKQKLNGIARQYTELAVREFAKKNNYNIVSNVAGKLTLVNRS